MKLRLALALLTLAVVVLVVTLSINCRPVPTAPPAPETLLGKTEGEVRALLGEPTAVGGAKLIGDKEVWQYDNAYQEPGVTHRSPIYVHIGTDGRVSHVTLFDGRELKP